MKNTGLYFGSFNPIHIGHLLVATYIKEAAHLDEIWFVVSPQNPFKLSSDLADENHRLEMVKLSIKNVFYFKAIDIEFQLAKPSYTHTTLKELNKQFPQHTFHVIIGEDNVAKLHDWKEIDWILDHYKLLVYNRQTTGRNSDQDARLIYYNLPLLDISSTEIRKRLKENKPVRYFVTENVEQYIKFHKLFI